MPDLALYDGAGEFPVVLGEVKLPTAELEDMAVSTDRDDQIGRYLRRTGVVLLTNVRGFALLVGGDARSNEPVPPQERHILDTVELWPSSSALKKGAAVAPEVAEALADLLERAVTEFAAIAEPESLARILARQARRAKQDLPKQFSQAVRPLLDDFGKALGLHFEGEDGEEFLRSSLIQTVFYGLFASWTLWHRAGAKGPFAWHDLSRWLRIPFLGALFHEFEHPSRRGDRDALSGGCRAVLRSFPGAWGESRPRGRVSCHHRHPVLLRALPGGVRPRAAQATRRLVHAVADRAVPGAPRRPPAA
jgi:hypothetical protein